MSPPNWRDLSPLPVEDHAASFAAAGRPVDGVVNDHNIWAREAAHRAKNLAQLTDALVAHQRRTGAGDPLAVRSARDVLHDLYLQLADEPEPGACCDCAPPLRDLVTGLVILFGPLAGDVSAVVGAGSLPLAWPQRRALLLIASELVINALRHAFPHGRGGLIEVRLVREGTDHCLQVRDDGIGLAPMSRSGLGSRIVAHLADMLDGRIQLLCGPEGGTCAELRFVAPPTVDSADIVGMARP